MGKSRIAGAGGRKLQNVIEAELTTTGEKIKRDTLVSLRDNNSNMQGTPTLLRASRFAGHNSAVMQLNDTMAVAMFRYQESSSSFQHLYLSLLDISGTEVSILSAPEHIDKILGSSNSVTSGYHICVKRVDDTSFILMYKNSTALTMIYLYAEGARFKYYGSPLIIHNSKASELQGFDFEIVNGNTIISFRQDGALESASCMLLAQLHSFDKAKGIQNISEATAIETIDVRSVNITKIRENIYAVSRISYTSGDNIRTHLVRITDAVELLDSRATFPDAFISKTDISTHQIIIPLNRSRFIVTHPYTGNYGKYQFHTRTVTLLEDMTMDIGEEYSLVASNYFDTYDSIKHEYCEDLKECLITGGTLHYLRIKNTEDRICRLSALSTLFTYPGSTDNSIVMSVIRLKPYEQERYLRVYQMDNSCYTDILNGHLSAIETAGVSKPADGVTKSLVDSSQKKVVCITAQEV